MQLFKHKYFTNLIQPIGIIYLWPCILFSIVNNMWAVNSHYPSHYPNSDYWAHFSTKVGPAMWYLMALFLYSILTKWIRRFIGITQYLIFACILAVAVGFLPIPNRYFDIQRISCLFPCFVFGLWFKKRIDSQIATIKIMRWLRLACAGILVLCILYNLFVIRYSPSMAGAFTTYYGLNMKAALGKWIMMTVRIMACVCLIVLMPNKEYWFTKYGSRTMNVYLLHDTLILLICWGLLYNYRFEWYGLLSCILLVPLLCTLLFSSHVDKFLKKILFSNYLKLIKSHHNEQGKKVS